MLNLSLAVLAQLVERVAFNHVVVGSIPTDGAALLLFLRRHPLFFFSEIVAADQVSGAIFHQECIFVLLTLSIFNYSPFLYHLLSETVDADQVTGVAIYLQYYVVSRR